MISSTKPETTWGGVTMRCLRNPKRAVGLSSSSLSRLGPRQTLRSTDTKGLAESRCVKEGPASQRIGDLVRRERLAPDHLARRDKTLLVDEERHFRRDLNGTIGCSALLSGGIGGDGRGTQMQLFVVDLLLDLGHPRHVAQLIIVGCKVGRRNVCEAGQDGFAFPRGARRRVGDEVVDLSLDLGGGVIVSRFPGSEVRSLLR